MYWKPCHGNLATETTRLLHPAGLGPTCSTEAISSGFDAVRGWGWGQVDVRSWTVRWCGDGSWRDGWTPVMWGFTPTEEYLGSNCEQTWSKRGFRELNEGEGATSKSQASRAVLLVSLTSHRLTPQNFVTLTIRVRWVLKLTPTVCMQFTREGANILRTLKRIFLPTHLDV